MTPGLNFGVVHGRRFVHDPYAENALALLDDGAPPPAFPRASSGGERFFNVWVHLTNACNLACPYCYIAKTPVHLADAASDRLLGAIERTAALGEVDRIHLRFAGGEPLLRFAHLRRLYEETTARCAPHGVRVTGAIITNGTVTPRGAPDWLRENGFSVSVSMDGLAEVQDTMRPRAGGGPSWDRLRRGLATYRAAGLDPYVLVTVGRTNLDALPDLVDFLVEEGLAFRLSLVRDLEWGSAALDDRRGAGAGRPERDPSLEGKALDRLLAVLDEAWRRVERGLERRAREGRPLPLGYARRLRFSDLELWRPLRKACGAGETYLAFGHDGTFAPCHAALHEPTRAALDGERPLPAQARGQTQCVPFRREAANAECRACPYHPSCAGGCPLLLFRRDGHVDGRSPYCAVFRAVIPRLLALAAFELLLAETVTSPGAPDTPR